VRHHVVDTFADGRFAGNPAAVVPAPVFPGVAEMQDVARRIGVPTTAFVVPAGPGAYRVRWFTPHAEMPLCGHATIASARHLFGAGDAGRTALRFVSPRGVLVTERAGDLVSIDLPAARLTPVDPPPGLLAALGVDALGTDALSCSTSDDDVLVELADAAAVAAVRPDFPALARQPFRGHIVTAPGDDGVDFVSRTFFPAFGVDEDQVCVSAHCGLAPFWARRLGRPALSALQLSARGGRLAVEDRGDRVRVLGAAVVRGGVRELAPDVLATP
jgi:PhzF family phenazine biosynthesis protein